MGSVEAWLRRYPTELKVFIRGDFAGRDKLIQVLQEFLIEAPFYVVVEQSGQEQTGCENGRRDPNDRGGN